MTTQRTERRACTDPRMMTAEAAAATAAAATIVAVTDSSTGYTKRSFNTMDFTCSPDLLRVYRERYRILQLVLSSFSLSFSPSLSLSLSFSLFLSLSLSFSLSCQLVVDRATIVIMKRYAATVVINLSLGRISPCAELS